MKRQADCFSAVNAPLSPLKRLLIHSSAILISNACLAACSPFPHHLYCFAKHYFLPLPLVLTTVNHVVAPLHVFEILMSLSTASLYYLYLHRSGFHVTHEDSGWLRHALCLYFVHILFLL